MAINEGSIIITTTPYIPGYRVVKVLGIAIGITVRTRGLGGRFLAQLRSLVGGEITEFVEMAEQARRQAIERMINHARELGANAIISFRLDSNELSDFMDEIIAYGTAVLIEPESQSQVVQD
ncbi:YbjQ family protein [Vulcanisaeta thermophila]|uniref:YbjQ family protein n=1 Tax=Vulcanisaeta thermophila TaxID=867917 RepID=UPI000852B544|nr:heavy metal-binding domain-containing protein [Vulcanisaeta thermophila]